MKYEMYDISQRNMLLHSPYLFSFNRFMKNIVVTPKKIHPLNKKMDELYLNE